MRTPNIITTGTIALSLVVYIHNSGGREMHDGYPENAGPIHSSSETDTILSSVVPIDSCEIKLPTSI